MAVTSLTLALILYDPCARAPPPISLFLPLANTPAATALPPPISTDILAPYPRDRVSMAQPQAATGPTAKPLSTARRAPYFSGRAENSIEDFPRPHDQLATSCRLTDQGKVETAIRYTAPSQRELWKSSPGYAARNWAEFRKFLAKVYTRTSSMGSYARTEPCDIVNQSSTSTSEEAPPGLARNSLGPKLTPLAPSLISAYQASSAPQSSQPSPRTTGPNPAPH